jgi:hypothetical protein
MSYLRFDKTLMTNLGESLPKEILRTNRSGAYHCPPPDSHGWLVRSHEYTDGRCGKPETDANAT